MGSDSDVELVEPEAQYSNKEAKQMSAKQRRKSASSQQPATQPSSQAGGHSSEAAKQTQDHRKRRRSSAAGPSSAPGGAEDGPFVFPQEEQAKTRHKIAKYTEESAKRADEVDLGLTNEDLERLAGKVVRHMLFSHFEKPGIPVTRNKLSEVITADYKTHKNVRKLPAVVIAMAQEKCLKALGLEMKELERQAASSKKDTGGEQGAGTKTYVLRSVLPGAVRQAVLPDPHRGRGAAPGLTMVVLALIHMEGGKMRDEALWEWLRELGVAEDQDHPSLGKIKEAMARMESCRYVVKNKSSHGQGQGHVFEWGECAHDEVGTAGIKAFIDNEFKNQYARPSQVQGEGEEPEQVVLDSD